MGARTRAAAMCGVALLAASLAAASSASAQYQPTTTTTQAEPPPPTTTTTTRPTTTTTRPAATTTAPSTTTTRVPPSTAAPTTSPVTVRSSTSTTPESEESTTTTTAPPPVIVHDAIDVVIVPGVPTPLPTDVTDADGNSIAFDEDVAPAVAVKGTGSQPAALDHVEITASIDEDGNLVVDITVPEDTPPQIVTVTIRAVDSRGNTRSLVYLIPVGGGGTTTTTGETSVAGLRRPAAARTSGGLRFENLATIPEAELPAVVKLIEAAIPDDATEQALLAQLEAEPGSVLTVDYTAGDATLAVSVRPIEADSGSGRGLVAAIGLGVAAAGLIALRRRAVAARMEGSR